MSERTLTADQLRDRDRICHEMQSSDLARRHYALELMIHRRLAALIAAHPAMTAPMKNSLDELLEVQRDAKRARLTQAPEQFNLEPPAGAGA